MKEKEALEATVKVLSVQPLSVQQSEGEKRDCDDVQGGGEVEQEGVGTETTAYNDWCGRLSPT